MDLIERRINQLNRIIRENDYSIDVCEAKIKLYKSKRDNAKQQLKVIQTDKQK